MEAGALAKFSAYETHKLGRIVNILIAGFRQGSRG
jgi:hypothetical protein